MRTLLPLAIAFISGLIMVIAFFINPEQKTVGTISQDLLIWSSIIGGFTFLLGAISITRVNWKQVSMRKPGWGYNLLTVLAVFVMAVPALWPAAWLPSGWERLAGRNAGSIYDWLFLYTATPMSQTMFAILAFYIASAAYRAFRARSTEATLLLLTASMVMLWRVPMGEAFLLFISPDLPGVINTYIMGGISLSVQRGIIIGAALGAATMSLRILLGIERTYMGRS
ncbi:MAG: hypothetical protein SGI97_08120 [candidate division Zixibacteria bacterium]|nr:hypothetical protein [candidate division Zixibacteria bacterium]